MNFDKDIQKVQKKELSVIWLISLVILVGLLSGVVGGVIVYNTLFGYSTNETVDMKTKTIVHEVTQSQDNDVIDIVQKTTPSVVSIIAKKDVPQYGQLFNTPYGLFYKEAPSNNSSALKQKQKVGGGTGFFVTTDGMIVTNRHVIADMDAEYSVITSNEEEYLAQILAVDDVLDFAVLKITPKNDEKFVASVLGNSDNIKIGQTVIAIGNSLGKFSHSVSRGIVSGVKRNIIAGGIGKSEQLTGIIQTDAAINLGNSGGPLIDLKGEVIGINTAIVQGAENIGFAMPINQVVKLIKEVKQTGVISQPFIGIRYVALTPEIIRELEVPYENGVLIVRGQNLSDVAVLPNSPADKAGLMENDVILQINDIDITTENSLTDEVSKYIAGDTIALKIWRNGEVKEVIITLSDKNNINKIQ